MPLLTKRREFLSMAFFASLLTLVSSVGRLSSQSVKVVSFMKFDNPDIMFKSAFWTPEQQANHRHYLSLFTNMGYVIKRDEKLDEDNGIIIVETTWKNRESYELFQKLLGTDSDRRVRNFAGLHFTETIHPLKSS